MSGDSRLSPSSVIQGKSLSFSEPQLQGIFSLTCNSIPGTAGWRPHLLIVFCSLDLVWCLEVDGNQATESRSPMHYSPFKCSESRLPAFSFSLKMSSVEIPIPALCGPQLGMWFFRGIVVKEKLKGNISKVKSL